MQVKLLAVALIEDEPDLDDEEQHVFGGQHLRQHVLFLLQHAPAPQQSDQVAVDYPEYLHERDHDEQMVFVRDGQREGSTDLLHEFWVVEDRVNDGEVGQQTGNDGLGFELPHNRTL